jgi:type III secretory pathway lipoprotein EscJ
MKFLRAVFVLCGFALVLAGCSSTPVADDVNQREANEIVAVLGKNKIQASLVKGRGSRARYSVVVQESDFANAAAVLSRLGLPADKKPSFQDLTAGNGIIPPSREVEALRLDRAISSELEDIFRARSDIASASVLVRMHSREASERPTVDTAEVREIARRAVPGIQNDDVYVSVAKAVERADVGAESVPELVPFLGWWRVRAEDHAGLVSLVVFLVGLAGVLAGLTGYIIGQFNWLNRQNVGSSSRSARTGGLSGNIVAQSVSSVQAADPKRQNGDAGADV